MSGVLRLGNTGAGTGRSTLEASASNDQTFTLPSAGGTLLTSNTSIPGETITLDGATINITNGDLNVDSGTLFVDESTNQVGIGTTSPTQLLHVEGSSVFLGKLTARNSSSSSAAVFEANFNGSARAHILANGSFKIGGDLSGDGNIYFDAGNGTGTFASNISAGTSVYSQAPNPSAYNFQAKDSDGDPYFSVRSTGTNNGEVVIGGTLVPFSPNIRLNRDGSGSFLGDVGIGTNSPAQNLHVSASTGTRIRVSNTGGGVASEWGADSANAFIGTATNHAFRFTTNNGERFRIDNTGRLLIGTFSALTGTNSANGILTIKGYPGIPTSAAIFNLARGLNSTALVEGNTLGRIVFADQQAGEYAFIEGECDGTTAVGDYPGRLVFSTTRDGASSPTRRMQITHDAGRLYFTKNGATSQYIFHQSRTGLISGTQYDLARIEINGSVRYKISVFGAITGTDRGYCTSLSERTGYITNYGGQSRILNDNEDLNEAISINASVIRSALTVTLTAAGGTNVPAEFTLSATNTITGSNATPDRAPTLAYKIELWTAYDSNIEIIDLLGP